MQLVRAGALRSCGIRGDEEGSSHGEDLAIPGADGGHNSGRIWLTHVSGRPSRRKRGSAPSAAAAQKRADNDNRPC